MIKKAHIIYIYYGTGQPVPYIKVPSLLKDEIFALPAEPFRWRVFRADQDIQSHLLDEPGNIEGVTRLSCPWVESELYGPLGYVQRIA